MQHFEQRRDDVEDGEAQHVLDAVGAALDGAGQAAGLAVEMEAQAEAVHVLEGLQRDAADGALLDGGEDGVAQFAEAGGGEAEQAVGDDEGGREVRMWASCGASGVHGVGVDVGT